MKIKNLTLAYGNKVVLRDINLEIKQWEFVFLIGSSGSWKTTLIRSLIWDFKPTKWKIILNDWEDLYLWKWDDFIIRYRREIWIIFQDYKLLMSRKIYENVSFAMEVCWYRDKYILQKVPEVLDQVWLLSKRDKFVNELSWWEMQRLAIARALVNDPEVIFWDEPTWNLDPDTAVNVMKIFDELNKAGKTIIIATHDGNIVDTMQKRVVAFKDAAVFSDKNKWKYSIKKS